MAEALKSGDVVRLKSGGPAMTVMTTGNGNAACVWFEGPKREQGSFPESGLVKVEGGGGGGLTLERS